MENIHMMSNHTIIKQVSRVPMRQVSTQVREKPISGYLANRMNIFVVRGIYDNILK